MSTAPLSASIEQQPAKPVAAGVRALPSFIKELAGWIKLVGASAIVALVSWLSWWGYALWFGGASAFDEPIGFVSGPTVQVDASHPVPLKSYFGIYVNTKAFDEGGNQILAAPADAEKRLGFWVHYQFVPDKFGSMEVDYFFAERTPNKDVDTARLLRDETPISEDTFPAFKGRQKAEFFFVERPHSVSPGELIYLVFYGLDTPTAAGQTKHLLTVVSSPIDGAPTWPQARPWNR